MKKRILVIALAAVCCMLRLSGADEMSMADRHTAAKLDSLMQGFYLDPSPEKVEEFLKLSAEFKPVGNRGADSCKTVFLGELFRRQRAFLCQSRQGVDALELLVGHFPMFSSSSRSFS